MDNNNPANTEGFEFLEFTTRHPQKLVTQIETMGFSLIAKHNVDDIRIYQQNNIRFILNFAQDCAASKFAELHGASVCSMGFRVKDAEQAFTHVINAGGKEVNAKENQYQIPAIYGVGNSIIYFVDHLKDGPNYMPLFSRLPQKYPSNQDVGLMYIDHITHNLNRGNMKVWADFYTKLFNFREIRYFDISGKLTGLKSQAMTSPCGKIRIPLNESSDDQSQIEEFIKDFNGEGIQHIALGTSNIYHTIEKLQKNNLEFLDTPDTYYEMIDKRLPGHGEPVDLLKKLRILIDGNTEEDKKLLLQIFTKNMLGPVFFEIIQRKGDEGFGEGNFRALFESIELDQIRRGVLTSDKKKHETSDH